MSDKIIYNGEPIEITDLVIKRVNKVAPMPLIPSTQYSSVKCVAEYLGVGESRIKDLLKGFKKDFEKDGVLFDAAKANVCDLIDLKNKDIRIFTGTGKYYIIQGEVEIEMPYSKTKLLTQKAIIRIATIINGDNTHEIRNVLDSLLLPNSAKPVEYICDQLDATKLTSDAIEALNKIKDLMSAIEECEEKIVAYDKFSQDILHDIEMKDMTDDELLHNAKLIKDVRARRRYNKNVRMVSDFINRQMSSNGMTSRKIDIMMSKLQNAKAKLEATENGKAYNRRVDELTDNQKLKLKEEMIMMG